MWVSSEFDEFNYTLDYPGEDDPYQDIMTHWKHCESNCSEHYDNDQLEFGAGYGFNIVPYNRQLGAYFWFNGVDDFHLCLTVEFTSLDKLIQNLVVLKFS